jgi:tRNA-dihydrouridine synthase B
MDIEGKALLAPISTFTNLPFRLLCQRHGAQGTMVPLVSAKAVCMHGPEQAELDPHPSEGSVGVQMFGSTPADIGKAAGMIAKKYDFIKYLDINCACPVKKLVKTGAGSALLHRTAVAAKMIEEASKCGLPITIKLRKLPDEGKTLDFCRACEKAGAAAFFVHGRTREQGYSGGADWEIIKRIAGSSSVPVIGSGDVRSVEDGFEKARASGCAAFMIGRAAMADPAIFSSPASSTPERKRSLFLEYISVCEDFDSVSFTDLKSKAMQMFSGFENSASARVRVSGCGDINGLMEVAESL